MGQAKAGACEKAEKVNPRKANAKASSGNLTHFKKKGSLKGRGLLPSEGGRAGWSGGEGCRKKSRKECCWTKYEADMGKSERALRLATRPKYEKGREVTGRGKEECCKFVKAKGRLVQDGAFWVLRGKGGKCKKNSLVRRAQNMKVKSAREAFV